MQDEPSPGRARWAVPLGATALAALGVLLWSASARGYRTSAVLATPPQPADRPIEVVSEGFTSSDACQACHPTQYESWERSFHRSMTQEVTPETVLADFDGTVAQFGEDIYRMERRGDEFWVEMADPDWSLEGAPDRIWRQVVLSTGSHHFQAYWFAEGAGRRISLLGICWRIDDGYWMPINAAFLIPEHSELPTRGRWNTGCHMCHTTGGEPRLRGKGRVDTHVVEFGIACESCHGPAEEHVVANRDPVRRYALHQSGEADATIVNPDKLDARLSAQTCGQCHGLTQLRTKELKKAWRENGFAYRAGDELLTDRELVSEGAEYYWPDGMVRVSGREYNGLVRTPCFQHDDEEQLMSCVSCHQLHWDEDDPRTLEEWRDAQLKPGMDGDRGCIQCHTEYEDAALVAEHTHHAPGSDGASCYNCHMPYSGWGLLKAIRSHEVSSPSVQESLEAGRPNACNLCHLDRPLQWAAEKLEEWWDIERPRLKKEEREVSAAVRWALSGDAGQRALVAWHMGWGPARRASGSDWFAPYLAQLLEDPYDAVRFRSYRSLRTLPGFEDFAYDNMAPPDERKTAHARAVARWQSLVPDPPHGTALLIRPGGELQSSRYHGLLRRRDDRPITLAE